jgi:hypothetical protein
MFFVNDDQKARHQFIRRHLSERTASIAVILASIDFEWMLRRAILGLGSSSTKNIHARLGKIQGGYRGYKEIWKSEVQKRLGVPVDKAISNWSRISGENGAAKTRGAIVHGASVPISLERATLCVDEFLFASRKLEVLSLKFEGRSLFCRIVRRKAR